MSSEQEREFAERIEAIKKELGFDQVIGDIVAERVLQKAEDSRLGYVEGRALVETVRQELNPALIRILKEIKSKVR